ncbi:MAG: hypothetical protein IKQ71_07760 [Lachnospiraceae bacterium]|nr:hypothetical protein [Lachnospiraceae bacterium]
MTENITLDDKKIYPGPVKLIMPDPNYVPDEKKLAESRKKTNELLEEIKQHKG